MSRPAPRPSARRGRAGGSRAAPQPPKHGVDDVPQFCARMDELHAELDPPRVPGAYEAHTDGACLGNPDGPGGWAAIVSPAGQDEPTWELWGHLRSTSNNRAETLGLLAALEWIPPESRLTLYADSQYTLKILDGAYKAKANTDLWAQVRATREAKRLVVTTRWVRGHSGHAGNERADWLAVLGAVQGDEARARSIRAGGPAAQTRRIGTSALAALPEELRPLRPRAGWDADFVESVTQQLRRGRPLSDKQRAQLERIRAYSAGETGAA